MAATAVSLTNLDISEPLPPHLEAKVLADAGFTEVYSIAGGTNAWTAEKLPTEKSAGKTKGN